MDWLAAATSPAIERISETVCVSPATMQECLHQLVLRRTLAKVHRQVAVGDLFGGRGDLVHRHDQRIEVLLDGVEITIVVLGDLRGMSPLLISSTYCAETFSGLITASSNAFTPRTMSA